MKIESKKEEVLNICCNCNINYNENQLISVNIDYSCNCLRISFEEWKSGVSIKFRNLCILCVSVKLEDYELLLGIFLKNLIFVIGEFVVVFYQLGIKNVSLEILFKQMFFSSEMDEMEIFEENYYMVVNFSNNDIYV